MEIFWMFVMLFASVVGGGIIGFQICNLNHSKSVGTLRVDKSDPDGPYLFLELESDPRFIEQKTYVTFRVDTKSYISQE